MPKTKFENIVFTLFMSFLMVYAMICYNIALNMGGMSNQVFLLAFHELIIKTPGVQIISVWFMTILFNFPMAFFWQICYCGPFVRWIFGKLFH